MLAKHCWLWMFLSVQSQGSKHVRVNPQHTTTKTIEFNLVSKLDFCYIVVCSRTELLLHIQIKSYKMPSVPFLGLFVFYCQIWKQRPKHCKIFHPKLLTLQFPTTQKRENRRNRNGSSVLKRFLRSLLKSKQQDDKLPGNNTKRIFSQSQDTDSSQILFVHAPC